MHITINFKSGRIYLPKEVVDFLNTNQIRITAEDYFFTMYKCTQRENGIKINKDNVIRNREVIQQLNELYHFGQNERIELVITDLITEEHSPTVYVSTKLPRKLK